MVVYYVLALALHREAGDKAVMCCVVDGLAWETQWQAAWHVPTKAALFQARRRLGGEPLVQLFTQVARPLGDVTRPGIGYRGRRLLSLDGTTGDVADTPANAAAFGRPGTGRGPEGAGGRGRFPNSGWWRWRKPAPMQWSGRF